VKESKKKFEKVLMEWKTRELLRKTRESDWQLDSVRIGKRWIAKGYLGLQGTGDESGTMDESKKPLSCREDVESDFKRLGTKSVNATFESL
jgi:hypothetical protein